MQRDIKIGMAVGVALVGIVGALFFRRDPEAEPVDEGPPALLNPEELDRRIAEKPKGPYINGVEDFAEPPAPAPEVKSPKPAPARSDAYEAPAFLTGDDKKQAERLAEKPPAAPDPIVPQPSETVATVRQPQTPAAGEPPPAHNRNWSPIESADAPPASPHRQAAARTNSSPRTHIIQPGETLSGIAARYLGSSARYREIFEANRDILRSPDALPDGVTIVIPGPAESRAPAAQRDPARPDSPSREPARQSSSGRDEEHRPASIGPDGRPKLRFVPVRRGYLSGRRAPRTEQFEDEPAADEPDSPVKPPRRSPAVPRIDVDDADDLLDP